MLMDDGGGRPTGIEWMLRKGWKKRLIQIVREMANGQVGVSSLPRVRHDPLFGLLLHRLIVEQPSCLWVVTTQ
jgi:hypothetical protein